MLKGDRVTLRALRRDDVEQMRQSANDVELELLGGDPPRPQSVEVIQAWYDEKIAKDNKDSVNFAIEADGKYIGFCGLWRFDLTAQTCELGIGIGDRDYWGRGYGREAIGLLLDYAFRLRNQRRVWLTTSSDNERALRCYRACGFVEEGRLRAHLWSGGRYVDQVIMGILREESGGAIGRAGR
jgi:RimJ/RimL family protein N-acetyltransferase